MEVRTYTPDDWPALREFIHAHWKAGHPYTHRRLFDWQFHGFGPGAGPVSKLMVHENEIVGFLGGIPGEYFVDAQIVRGVVFDLWVVRPDHRDRALGLLLMQALEREFETTCCLGVNPSVIRFYTARGYAYADRLNRYVSLLDASRCGALLRSGGEQDVSLKRFHEASSHQPRLPENPPPSEALHDLYERTVERVFRYGLHRSAAFWQWRYRDSTGFSYLFWGDPTGEGVIVGRIERIVSPEQSEFDGWPVLRLIELLPATEEAWQGGVDAAFLGLLQGVLSWAVGQGCVLADYQNSSNRLERLLLEAGLGESGADATLARTPNLFQPLRFNAAPINYVWRMDKSLAGIATPQPRDIYFVKSDDGMDRPNIWPLPAQLSEAEMTESPAGSGRGG